jgi:hypothetical protein
MGDRRIVSVESLEQFHDATGYLKDFARQHAPFWRPSLSECLACELLISRSPMVSELRSPFSTYHLQFAGVTVKGERTVVVHGFCPQGPRTASYTRVGGELVFAEFHTGTCYFSAYCHPETGGVPTLSFGTPGR